MIFLIFFLPFTVQTILMTLDEYLFHRKRFLPLWERIGHPIDTLSVLAIYGFLLINPYNAFTLKVGIGLAVFSCLCITKDEFVHKHHCCGTEQWLHAVLFINHPILLASLGILWPALHGEKNLGFFAAWMPSSAVIFTVFLIQFFLIFLFFLYQIIYWNFLWKEKKG